MVQRLGNEVQQFVQAVRFAPGGGEHDAPLGHLMNEELIEQGRAAKNIVDVRAHRMEHPIEIEKQNHWAL